MCVSLSLPAQRTALVERNKPLLASRPGPSLWDRRRLERHTAPQVPRRICLSASLACSACHRLVVLLLHVLGIRPRTSRPPQGLYSTLPADYQRSVHFSGRRPMQDLLLRLSAVTIWQ